MATYAIGDLQGCLAPLQRLLRVLPFDSTHDRLWFTGDLVNRGPQSLETLRFVRSLGDAAITVLGNHDLHLLAVSEGAARLHRGDTLEEILEAPDASELLDWLRGLPLMHVEGRFALVHAGLLPQWTVPQALLLADEVREMLCGPRFRKWIQRMYGNHPDHWSDELEGWDRLRVIVNAMTRLRICTADGTMEFSHKGEPARIPPGYMPWFEAPGRRSASHEIVFGHWSALGWRDQPGLLAIDTGCLWGRELTAVRLEDRQVWRVQCLEGGG